jgi:hypothetical protein
LRGKKRGAIRKAVLNRNVVPAEYVEGIQVVNYRERVQFVKSRRNTAILDIRQAADVKNHFRTAS